jgi:hypothetical protein
METLRIDNARFDEAMRKLIKVGGPIVIKDEAALLVKELIRMTPPTAGRGSKKFASTDQQAGLDALTRDIGRAVRPIIASEWNSPAIKKMIENRNANGFEQMLRATWDRKAHVLPFSPSLHSSVRDTRGRVPRSRSIYTFDVQAWKTYVEKIRKRVGLMKASWMQSALALGVRAPGYVKRHSGRGAYSANLESLDSPSVTMTSGAKGADSLTGAVKQAMIGRAKRMESRIRRELGELKRDKGLGGDLPF